MAPFYRRLVLASSLLVVASVGAYLAFFNKSLPPSPELSGHVTKKSSVPIVFTSRTSTSSFTPEAPEAEGFREPVTIPWAAKEGRLRLLDTSGKVTELTWNRKLPDGGTIIDVMSPSVSLDGKRILFAGRKAAPDRGRWRIFEVQVDGSELRQLTGNADDLGCIAVPPLRFKEDGSVLNDSERRKLDFDDVDPTDLGPNGIAFASSRLPDLGRDHSRRATQIWTWAPGANAPTPITANRNNDRWPILLASEQVLFSTWSRNREAIAADRAEVRPVSTGGEYATKPTDNWMAAIVMSNAAQFGYAVKSVEPVWRPRPLFNGRIVFMTQPTSKEPMRLAQADWGYIRISPSSLNAGESLPYEGGAALHFGPNRDAEGRALIAATPSAAPDHRVLFSGVVQGEREESFGLYEVNDDWTKGTPIPELLFNDPNFVDSEPVAVYPRKFIPDPRSMNPPLAENYKAPASLNLLNGEKYSGPMGFLENIAMSTPIRNPIPWHDTSSGKRMDPRMNPLVSPPPNVASVSIYAAGRDRFDDAKDLRVPGKWEKLMTLAVQDRDNFTGWVPSDPLRPIVLVGEDDLGKVATWSGRSRKYFAYAGDHYSGIRKQGYHYCNGCHTGHTFTVLDPTERVGK